MATLRKKNGTYFIDYRVNGRRRKKKGSALGRSPCGRVDLNSFGAERIRCVRVASHAGQTGPHGEGGTAP